jgi:hypothetical protein
LRPQALTRCLLFDNTHSVNYLKTLHQEPRFTAESAKRKVEIKHMSAQAGVVGPLPSGFKPTPGELQGIAQKTGSGVTPAVLDPNAQAATTADTTFGSKGQSHNARWLNDVEQWGNDFAAFF